MMIYTRLGKSKPKLRPKKEREEYAAWLAKHTPKTTVKKQTQEPVFTMSKGPWRRQTEHFPSLNTGLAWASASTKKVYTGDKMLGIGTLHKSNAVPVFTQEEAQDMAKMRR